MKNTFFLLCAFLAGGLIAGCSTSKSFHIEPEYQKNKKTSSVLVLPIQRTWFQNNYTYTFGNVSGTGGKVFWESLENLLARNLKSMVEVPSRDATLDTGTFEATSLPFEAGETEVMIPNLASGTDFEFNGRRADMVLLLDKFYYRKVREFVGGNSYAGHEGREKTFLYFETKYVYWDAERKKIAAWGSTDASVTIGQDAGYSDYLEALDKAVKKIAKNSPVI